MITESDQALVAPLWVLTEPPRLTGMHITKLLLALASVFAVACGDNATVEPDAPPPPPLVEQVVGVWQHVANGLVVDVRDDGSFFAATSIEGLLSPFNQGTYVVKGDRIHVIDVLCGELALIGSITDGVLSIAPDGPDLCPLSMTTGSYTRVDGPAVLAGDSFLDEVIGRGDDLIDDVRRDVAGSNYIGCVGCTVVVEYELSRPRIDRYEITHNVYYDAPFEQAMAGDLACTARNELAVRRLAGFEPSEAVDLYWIVRENTCGWPLPLNFHAVWRATGRDAGGPTQIAEWDATLGTAFPGWSGEGGKAGIYRLCPDADKNSFGYCQPTCSQSAQPDQGGSCILPAPQ